VVLTAGGWQRCHPPAILSRIPVARQRFPL